MEDECHLLWGDTLGYVWGKRNKKIDVPVLNERERQTYYGAVDCFTGDFHLFIILYVFDIELIINATDSQIFYTIFSNN